MPDIQPSSHQLAQIISCLDHTDLADHASEITTDILCRKIMHDASDHQGGNVAAVCVWPQFVTTAKHILHHTPVKIATVVNFPSGNAMIDRVMDDVRESINDGAHEIDLVFPYARFIEGDTVHAREMIENVRDLMQKDEILKVILETSAFSDAVMLRSACELAVGCGADFLKTSTGKNGDGATPASAHILLDVIKQSPRAVGLKISGGLKTLQDVLPYIALINEKMGEKWISPNTFRIGSSNLYDAIFQHI